MRQNPKAPLTLGHHHDCKDPVEIEAIARLVHCCRDVDVLSKGGPLHLLQPTTGCSKTSLACKASVLVIRCWCRKSWNKVPGQIVQTWN